MGATKKSSIEESRVGKVQGKKKNLHKKVASVVTKDKSNLCWLCCLPGLQRAGDRAHHDAQRAAQLSQRGPDQRMLQILFRRLDKSGGPACEGGQLRL